MLATTFVVLVLQTSLAADAPRFVAHTSLTSTGRDSLSTNQRFATRGHNDQ
jgi:hypothetical protein